LLPLRSQGLLQSLQNQPLPNPWQPLPPSPKLLQPSLKLELRRRPKWQ
jgi:hypothetical protein